MNSRQEFEILVIGAGPAGIAAACAAAEAGRRVAVLDNSPWLGGQIWRGEQSHPVQARRWIQRLRNSGAVLFPNATVFDVPAAQTLLAETLEGVLEFGWQKLILAPGARELFIPFPGWTLPGVVGPGGLHAMSKAGWPVAGKRIVVAGSGPLLLAVADGLKQHGAEVVLVAEQAPFASVMRFGFGLWRYPGKLAQALGVKARLLSVPYRCGCWPVKAEGTDRVESVSLTDGVRTWTERCDYLACGFHLVPNLELPLLLGCELVGGAVAVRVDECQETSVPGVYCAGEPTGIGGVECALVEGEIAGLAAVGREAGGLFRRRAGWHRFRDAMAKAFSLRPELLRLATPETLVCRCEDVPRGALEPHANWRAAKLHTRCGMGPCQGRICGAAARVLFGWDNDSVRPPIFPVSVGSLIIPSTQDSKRR